MSFSAYTIIDRTPAAQGAPATRFYKLIKTALRACDCGDSDSPFTKASAVVDWFVESSGADEQLCLYVPWAKAHHKVKRLGRSAEQRFVPIFDTLWRYAWPASMSLAFPDEKPGNAIRIVLKELLHETQGRSIVDPTSCSNVNNKIAEEIAKLDNNEFRSASNAMWGAELAKLILASKEFTKKKSANGGSSFTQDSEALKFSKALVTRIS